MQSFKLRKTKGKACCFLHAGACATSVSGFCRSGRIFAALVCLGEREVFASELALAEACADPKSGPHGGPKFGAFLLATKSGSAHVPRRQAQPGAVAAWNVCARRP